MKLTDSTYERLTPDERFRVTVEAFARGDIEEVDRLQDTCGYVSIRQHAPAYFQRLRSFWELSMMQGIKVRDQLILFYIGLHRLTRDEPDERDVLVTAVENIKALTTAWEVFCNELAIDPDKADWEKVNFTDHAFAIALVKDLEDGLEPTERLEPNAEMHSMWLEHLRGSWRKRIENVRGIEKLETTKMARNGK